MQVYEGNEPYIFVSYAHKDTQRVVPIIEALQKEGFRVWYDSGIEAGTEWPAYIEEHLDGCDKVLVCMSEATVESVNCRNEINYALALKRDILVVYLEETKLRYGMGLQLGASQSVFSYQYSSDESFFEKIRSSRLLQSCRAFREESAAEAEAEPISVGTEAEEVETSESTTDIVEEATEADSAEAIYEQALGIDADEELEKAVHLYRKAARMGHVKAQFRLGTCYFLGKGIPRDEQQAAVWFTKAALAGEPEAQNYLGTLYRRGRGVPTDDEKAAYWFCKSAEQGYAYACHNLALCCAKGAGVPQDEQQAVHWFRVAAQAGLVASQRRLAECYRKGLGVEKDLLEARKWYSQAAKQGDAQASEVLEDRQFRRELREYQDALFYATLPNQDEVECAYSDTETSEELPNGERNAVATASVFVAVVAIVFIVIAAACIVYLQI